MRGDSRSGKSGGLRDGREGMRRFFDPLGEFHSPPRARSVTRGRKQRRQHECLWCGEWFPPRKDGRARFARFCSLACRRSCHQRAIPAGVAAGESDREIARRLDLSPMYLREKRLALRVLRRPEPPQLRRYRLEEDV